MLSDSIFLMTLFVMSISTGRKLFFLISDITLDVVTSFALAMPLGLGIFGTLVGVGATLGFFETGLIISALIGLICSVWSLIDFKGDLRPFIKTLMNKPSFTVVVFVFLVFSTWLGIHSPVIDGDALCYHLEVAKRMTFQGGLNFDPDLHETAYPLIIESLQSVAIYLASPIATRSISFLFGLSLACSTILLARSFVSLRNSIWAGSMILTLPIINCGMISPLNDVPLAAICVASLASFVFLEDKVLLYKRNLISAIYCGLACGVKFPGIVWTTVMASMVLCYSMNKVLSKAQNLKNGIKVMTTFCCVVLIIGGFWYMRAAILTGNPVHPYFRDTFGGHGLDEVLSEDRKSVFQHMINIITALVVMSLAPRKFDSFSQQIGPLTLAFLPIGFLMKMPKKWFVFLLISWTEMVLCLIQRQSPRFFLASFAPICAASVAVVFKIRSLKISQNHSWKRGACSLFILILILTTLLFNLARVKTSVVILAGFDYKESWLAGHEPTAWLRNWTDFNLPAGSKLIGQDHRGFYWPRLYTMEKAHRRRLGMDETNINTDMMIAHLKHSGFTHLVMAEPIPLNSVEFDPVLSIILAKWLETNKPVIDVILKENDGYQRRYRIFALQKNTEEQICYPVDEAIEKAGVIDPKQNIKTQDD
ncbi:MAG: hypothetical protein ACKO85_15225 [Isosphaeraceae bacterium]